MNIEIIVPDNKICNYEISTFEVSENDAKFFNLRELMHRTGRSIFAGTYKKLTYNGSIIMSNTPAEIRDHSSFFNLAKQSRNVLVNGLGIGLCIEALKNSEKLELLTIVEISKEVIDLVQPTYKDDKRIQIIHCSAFDYKPPKGMSYDAVWHDIWNNITSENLPEMTKLHRKYGRKALWQGSWCKKECQRLK